jgi:hypothetical protein
MGSLVKYTLIISAVIALVSFWNRNNFPDDINYIAGLNDEPKQNPIKQDAFSVSYENVNYIVEPQYDYELYGLVVSYRHHDGDSMLHKLWNDHLNAADVCVLWGNTAKSQLLNKLTFWNGQFTCNVKTRDREAWANFNMTELANNHLLTSDDYLRDKISSLKVGDQIYIKGRLASYGSPGGSKRGTSTTRTDTGNGACETIFVDDFQIVDRPSNIWRSSLTLSSLVFVLTLLFYFFSPYRPHR